MTEIKEFAARFLNTTASHIFLTGKAGTGKTTFLKNLASVTHKNFIVVAPTGIAALNAGGVTIHSQFLFPPAIFIPDRFLPSNLSENSRIINGNILARQHPLNSARKKVLRSIDLLVIDEVSMLRADLLDAMDYRLKAARGNFSQSFGGVQLLFIGDLFQLPPVVRSDEQALMSQYYQSPWFYEAHALKHNKPVYLELDKIFRQSNPVFIDLLNNLRNNVATPEDIDLLNKHYQSSGQVAQQQEVITLTTHNYKADQLNMQALKNLQASSHFFDAFIEGDFPENMYPVLPQLELKEGAQIMFTRNDVSVDKKYFNGKLATVKTIEDDEVWVELAETRELYLLSRERWENKKYTVHVTTQVLEEEVIGSFEQYPVKLAWAITVHKSQGLTFDKAIIDVASAFADGQVYVALSRLRSLEGLVLSERIHAKAISTDIQVAAFTKEHHQPQKLATTVQEKQQHYLQEVLEKTFNFNGLLKEIHFINTQKDNADRLENPTMKPVLTQVADALATENSNTEKFRNQLRLLLHQQSHEQLLERIHKGSTYYRQLIVNQIKLLLEHSRMMQNQKRVKTYVSQLQELDLAFTKKLEEIDTASLLVEGILNNIVPIDFTQTRNRLKEERKQWVDKLEPVTEKKSKPKRKSKTGNEKSTYDITLEYFKKGMKAEAIAAERGLVLSTIEGHLAKAVEIARLDIFEFMQPAEVEEISAALAGLPQPVTSKNLYDQLNGKYAYGKLRAVMAYAGSRVGDA